MDGINNGKLTANNTYKDILKYSIKRHLGSLEQGKWLLQSPRQIEVRSDGLIFVCDFKGDRILALTEDNMLAHIISEISGIPLIAPSGVASDSRNRLFITDDHSCIVGMDKELNLLEYIGTEEAEGALINFQGLHVDKDDNLFAIDNHHKQIRHYDKSGRLVRFFGEKGNDDNQFSSLKYIVTKGNDIYVSDPQANKIKVYTKDGRFQYAFGAKNEHENISSPRGMCFVDDKYLLVCDSHNDSIEIFDQHGRYIQPLITGFEDPEDVNLTLSGSVIACMNDRLAVLH
ncbi:hypothetical protein GJ496_003609 [Pomphorhynchus laevis]|nr:hypothetical protein GJ496_003609 [Pomphorhynchus laevis]